MPFYLLVSTNISSTTRQICMNGSYREILFIESVLSGTVCMWGQNFVLHFHNLWGQFVSCNSPPCNTQYS